MCKRMLDVCLGPDLYGEFSTTAVETQVEGLVKR